ncbi:hypothetical protein MVEN_01488500 [Mycena venus]|uniref:Proteophosphoglycan ppg4 n=1 Tax=Mycena venus TaxID=2733690 RepID=A0A8H6XW16_9AGAR|nr:hypothetical protein MVEN_01488500 [Mycena venus]
MHPPRPNTTYRRAWHPLLALLAALAPNKISAAPGSRQVFDDSNAFDFDALQVLASTPTTHHRHVPPKYSPGADGMWRRIDSYTLVGSTICDTCTLPTPTSDPSEAEIRAAVPPEWIRDTVSSPTRTTITIALSVVLACFIFLTLLRFHFVRARAPRPRSDVEKRRHRASVQSTETLNDLKGQAINAQTTKRKWMARATARWRENARLLARQRRARRQRDLATISRRGSSESLVTPAPQAPPRSASPAPSSLSSSSLSAASSSTTSLASLAPPPEPEPQMPPIPNEPPAYPLPSISVSPLLLVRLQSGRLLWMGCTWAWGCGTCSTWQTTGRTSLLIRPVRRLGPMQRHTLTPPPPQLHSAHLATDDKALLARLAERASAPGIPPPRTRLREERSGETLASTRTATSTSTSAPSSSSASTYATSYAGADVEEARAPEEDDLPLEIHIDFGEMEGIDTSAPPFDDGGPSGVWGDSFLPRDGGRPSVAAGEKRTAGTSQLPAPPAPTRVHGSGRNEKMALERAYAAREAEAHSAYPHSDDVPMYPSAPAYAYPEEPEAGPSTPRASVLPSAPPLMEEEYAFEGFEWDERGGEGGECAAVV